MQQRSISTSQNVSKVDLPRGELAPYGVLSKYEAYETFHYFFSFDLSRIYTQMSRLTNANHVSGFVEPLQNLPGAIQLDMNTSCLFIHEVNMHTLEFLPNQFIVFHYF